MPLRRSQRTLAPPKKALTAVKKEVDDEYITEESEEESSSEKEDDEFEIDEEEYKELEDRSRSEGIRTRSKRSKITIANGEVVDGHSRLKVSEDGQKRFRFRSAACQNNKTTSFNIQEYLVAVRNTRENFYNNIAKKGCIPQLSKHSTSQFEPSEPDPDNLEKWLTRSSQKLAIRTNFSAKKKHTVATKAPTPSSLHPEHSLSLFTSHAFEYSLSKPKHVCASRLVDAMMNSKKLIVNENVYETLKEIEKSPEARKQRMQALFCGGPVIAIKTAPQCASDGREVVAIITAADEVAWKHDPAMPTYVQFWKYSSETSVNASLWFLLKIENVGTISDMSWCPFYHQNVVQKLPQKRSNVDTNTLGYIAFTTDVGKILIYKIPKQINISTDPPVFTSTPEFVLEHATVLVEEFVKDLPEPKVKDEVSPTNKTPTRKSRRTNKNCNEDAGSDVEINEATPKQSNKKGKKRKRYDDDDEDSDFEEEEESDHDISKNTDNRIIPREVSEASFIWIDWSPFDNCRSIIAVSSVAWVFFYDLTKGAQPVNGLYDVSWDAPPTSACWVSETIVAVVLASKSLLYYDITSKERIYVDNTPRSIGALALSQPVVFPGVFSFDAVRVISEDNQGQYMIGVYHVINVETSIALVAPIPNKHQGQCFHMAVCESSGIIGSVGSDGRLVQSMNGRFTPRDEKDDFACSVLRPALQLVRHRQDIIPSESQTSTNELNKMKKSGNQKELDTPLIEHDKVVAQSWLEVRVGDAALIDQESNTKSSTFVEKVTFDRRTESLTRVEFSKLSPGLAITGGEAGIVFIVPTSL